ncbi:MAG: oligosaccharide flippase family protein [Phycisphaerales bacterium]|nr:MAG: oligosaccharide flippase family protein [Phycisphaerales bacterium]
MEEESDNTMDSPETSPVGFARRFTSTLRRDAGRMFTVGVPHLFAAMALTQGIGMLRRILLARILDVDELGQMTYVMRIVDFIAIVADIGISNAVLKYAAEPVGVEQKRRIYVAGLIGGSVVATVVALLYMAGAWYTDVHDDPDIRLFMLMVVPYLPLSAVVRTPIVYMQACKEVKKAARYTALTAALSLVLIVAATYWKGLPGFFVTVTFAPLCNLVVLLFVTRRELSWHRPAWNLLKRLSSFGSFSMLSQATEVAGATVTVVLLRTMTHSDYEVGLYSIGLVVMVNIRLIPLALMRAAFPYLAGLVEDTTRFSQRLRELSLKQTAVMIGIVAGWAVLGYYAIILVFGSRYADSFCSSAVLVLAVIPLSMSVPWARAIAILDKMQWNLAASVIQLTTNVLACLWLVPIFGATGAALALVMGEAVGSGIRLIVGRILVSKTSSVSKDGNAVN